MKFYLLIAGFASYDSFDEQWIKCFDTEQEADSYVEKVPHYIKTRANKFIEDKPVSRYTYKINGTEFDWYKVVDLKKWVLQ